WDEQGVDDTGGPMISARAARAGLLLRAITFDRPPDGPDLGRRDLLPVLGLAVGTDAFDDLRSRAACRPPAPARHFHQHGKSLTSGGVRCALMAIAENLEVAAFLKGQPKKLLIGGRWADAADGKTFETVDPATGEILARVAEAGAEDIDRAVAAARKSFDRCTWRDLPPAERAKVLWKIGDMIEERAIEFAQLETLDNGMPINDALLFHAPIAAATFRYYAGWVTKLDG